MQLYVLIGSAQPGGNWWGLSIIGMYYRGWSRSLSSSSSSSRARRKRSINHKVMWALIQWHQFSPVCLRVERCLKAGRGPLSDRVENVKNGSARRRWWGARRDDGERASERKAGVSSSRGDERVEEEELAPCSGKRVVGTFTYGQHQPPSVLLLPPSTTPSPGDASMTTKTFPWCFFDNKAWTSCSLQQVFRSNSQRDLQETQWWFLMCRLIKNNTFLFAQWNKNSRTAANGCKLCRWDTENP